MWLSVLLSSFRNCLAVSNACQLQFKGAEIHNLILDNNGSEIESGEVTLLMCDHCLAHTHAHAHTCSKGQVQASNPLQFPKQKPLPVPLYPETFHLFMIRHQVRESVSPTIACFQELQKPRCRPLGVCFPGLWAEMKAREREKHDLPGIFMLLKMTLRLLKTPGRDPPSVPASERRSKKMSLGGETAWLVPPAWNQGYKGALFPYLPSRPSVLPSSRLPSSRLKP